MDNNESQNNESQNKDTEKEKEILKMIKSKAKPYSIFQ